MGVSPHLKRAYELARQNRPHPNPRVGAVVVSEGGRVLGEGAHVGPGEPHAEMIALDAAGDARGSTVFVSLEPCTHHGRTPPCVDRLIAESVSRVVVGALDPDPRVSGSGAARLAESGIEVDIVDDPEAAEVDPAYFHHRTTGLPLVTLKWAMTLDGSVAAVDGTSRGITGEAARREVHELRSQMDAVVVGAGTLRTDDPRLDVRLDGYDGPQPRPVIIAGKERLPEDAQVWDRNPLVITHHDRELPAGELAGAQGEDNRPDPVDACRLLADRGYLDVLVEGGPTLASAWWRAGVVSRGVVYVGAKVGGGIGQSPLAGLFATMTEADEVEFDTVRSVSDDAVITFRKKG